MELLDDLRHLLMNSDKRRDNLIAPVKMIARMIMIATSLLIQVVPAAVFFTNMGGLAP
jgi:hypothetical protein